MLPAYCVTTRWRRSHAVFGMRAGMLYSVGMMIAAGSAAVPVPTARQLEFMELETIQFMHFGLPTFWEPPSWSLQQTHLS